MKITLYPKYLIRSLFVHGKHDFFNAGYKLLYPEYSRHGMTPWQHYVMDGKRKGFSNGNNPTDDIIFREGYETEYPDVKAAGVDPWRHYAEKGFAEGRDNGYHPSQDLFFSAGYLEMYPDVAESGMDPWRHYVMFGKKEGRDNGLHPGDDEFLAAGYMEMYPDVVNSGMDPWHHYVLYGKQEGRDNGRHPDEHVFFSEGYRYNYPSCVYEPYGNDLWINYIKIGKAIKRNNGLKPVTPFFNGSYFERHPDGTDAQAWKDYILNFYKDPNKDLNLYAAETGMREILKRKNPCVAVIMPVYNRKDIVMNAVTSVRDQTWANWHLYIVDDFSDDGTFAYLKSVISDPRIILLKSEVKGVCGARDTAIAHMQNEEYVAYLDSDNTWNLEYLELMLCRLIETNTLCCYGVQKLFQRTGVGSIKVIGFRDNVFDISKLRINNFIDLNVFMHSSCVFKELGVFDTSLRRMVDWDFILRCAEKHTFSKLPYVSCNYDDTEDKNRITQKHSFTFTYGNIVRNKHWFDWQFLKNVDRNDEFLVSVIIYFGKSDSLEFLRNCLNSLKNARSYSHSQYRTEIILVDDSCTEEIHSAVSSFYEKSLIDKYLINSIKLYTPLSSNKALNVALGRYVVYLDSHSYVSVNWLDPLINPLKRHHDLKGTTSKILLPDGTINSVGNLFDSISGLPYDLLHALPSDFDAAKQYTLLPSTNGYCCAFRTSDVIGVMGLYCIYQSKLSVADLCLQLGNGRSCFAYVPSSSVICPDDSHLIAPWFCDLEPFAERWFGKTLYDEHDFIDRKHLDWLLKCRKKVNSFSFKKYSKTAVAKCSADYYVPVYNFSKLSYGCVFSREMQRQISRIQSVVRLVVIKDPSPGKPYYKKYEWGDYYYARSLARAFARLGFDTRIDNLEDWYSHDDGLCINIVLRGITEFDCSKCPDSINIMWLISHPDMISVSELAGYDCVFAASEFLVEKYAGNQSLRVPCIYLPQCTDPEIFAPAQDDQCSEAYSAVNLFLGNSRGVMRDAIKMCIEEDVDVQIIGNGWDNLVEPELIRSGAVPSFLVPFLYRSAEVVLNDHWDDMRQNRIASNRIFDVLACGRGIVTDNFESIPEELKFACFSYDSRSIKEAVDKCRMFNKNITEEQKDKLRNIICDRYSFDRRALQIAETVYPILEKKQKTGQG